MAKNHASVAYVEPNDVFSGLTAAAGDGNTYDRAPDLEDYCIALDIEVELSSREDAVHKNTRENTVLVMSYRSNGKDEKVSFLSGSRICEGDAPNMLTTKYADMFITDLVDYGTTEMIGVKSLDIEYNNACVPMISIKFVDVRGMSLFQPTELNNNKSFNGIRGFSKDNIAQSFFHSFFVLPLPRFVVRIKGFYGRPVAYEVMCQNFDASFNSKTGDFEINTKFIGFAYSFMSDISFDALLAAPYSDYIGSKHWDDNVANGRFTLPDKTGEDKVPMPRLYEIRKWFKTIMNQSDTEQEVTTVDDEEMTHDGEIAELDQLKKLYRSWYSKLYELASKKYGKDFVYVYGGNTDDEEYERIVIFTNGKNITGVNLADEYLQYDDDFKQTNLDLYNAVEAYNGASESYRKLTNVSKDFSDYTKIKTFNELWYNDRKDEIVFEGFHRDNLLPREETIKLIFNGTDTKRRLRKFYDDGVSQYIDAFVIEVDYSDLKRRIKSLIEDSNKTYDRKLREKKIKEHNRYMFEQMKWYPSVENFTKIVMAHLETLMAMMYDVIEQTKDRTAEELGITIGEDGDCCDVNPDCKIIPPFPRVTKLITDSDGLTKREDAWVGNYNSGKGFKEVEMVNGLLNGVAMINKLEKDIIATQNEIGRDIVEPDNRNCIVKYPLSPFDLFIKDNPYGTESDISNDRYAFVGKVCMRMFSLLAINGLRNEFKDRWMNAIKEIAESEAENFKSFVKLTNVTLMGEIGEYGAINSGEKILNIVTGNEDKNNNATNNSNNKRVIPWDKDKKGTPLFSDANGIWLNRYATSRSAYKTFIYPIQDPSFSALDESLGRFNEGQIEVENSNISINRVVDNNAALSKFMKTSSLDLFNTIYIGRYYEYIKTTFENASSNASDSYKPIIASMITASTLDPNLYKEDFDTSPDFVSAFNAKLQGGLDTNGALVIHTGESVVQGMNLSADGHVYESGEKALDSYFSLDVPSNTVNNAVITEIFGFKREELGNGKVKYTLDKDRALFLTPGYYALGTWEVPGFTFTTANVKSAFFVMGIDCFSYAGKNLHPEKTFCIVSNLMVLQIGAVLAALASRYSIGTPFDKNIFELIRSKIHVSERFENGLKDFLNSLSPIARIQFIKYFVTWSNNNFSTIDANFRIKKYSDDVEDKDYVFIARGVYKEIYKNSGIHRALLNQDSNVVASFTNVLMTPVMVVRGTINSLIMPTSDESTYSNVYKVDRTQAQLYLDCFLTKLRDILGIGQPTEESNNVTSIAKTPSQTTEDMKIEMYRYLKQVFDKWIPATRKSEWNFETFFTDEKPTGDENVESTGHLFHFIDSYYNKIGSKLLINPMKLADKITLSTSYSDVNVMMFNFLAEVFAEHRCMMKCVQNFRDLSEGMEDLFQPIPYIKMGKPDRHPDFVVIYTYAASKNLNVANSEFNDDGFMLNDEMETPLAIRTRGNSDDRSNETSTYYRIPAFGVSYGRQYQSYFKDIHVDMSNPVMTQQAIIAKHAILNASRDDKSKVVTSQDLYDIYTNQSYTCRVEMMGCAWIQPLMYFVLLNVPMFRGSYMIMKVIHRMRPGDMTTEITGCRMANVTNRMVEDIFSDETDENTDTSTDSNSNASKADVNNDCPYKVFPVSEEVDESDGNPVALSGTQKEKAHKLMTKFISMGYTKEAAAGIVGNIRHEVGEEFDCTKMPAGGGKDSDGYFAAGFCQWNDHYGNLTKLLTKVTTRYGDKEKDGSIKRVASSWGIQKIKSKLASYGPEYQLDFIDKTIEQVTESSESTKKYTKAKLNACKTPEEAAESFRAAYERGSNPSARKKFARSFYDTYKSTTPQPTPEPPKKKEPAHDTKKFSELFFTAVQRSAYSSPSTSVNLEPTYEDGNVVRIKQKDGNNNKLGNVFDIILNSYYDYVQTLIWYYKDAPRDEASEIKVTVAEQPNKANRLIYILCETNSSTDIGNDPAQINEKFLRAVAKRYPDPVNNKNLPKEVPQFKGKQEMLKEYAPDYCPTCHENNADTGNEKKSTPSPIATSAKIKIDDWDVGKAVEWINTYSRDSYVVNNKTCKPGGPRRQDNPNRCDGLCAKYVEYAIAAGGGPLSKRMECGGNTGAATNLRYRGILEHNGFQMIESGGQLAKHGNSKIQPQAGDVCIIGRDYEMGAGGKFHACMWNGKQWVSDFKQSYMNVYNNPKYDLFPYAIYRFHNKQGTPYA